MKISNALFYITLLTFTCLINTQQVFDQVKTMLVNFKSDIQREQIDATNRFVAEEKYINEQIAKAIAVLAQRTKDVNDIKAHIVYLKNEITQTQKDIQSRKDRIAANARLLVQFKKERCENNLIFVKSLREHIEGIEVMGLLRGDIVEYFAGAVKKTAFLEKFEEFSHLLDEEHKLILSQLTTKLAALPNVAALNSKTNSYTTTSGRTSAQIGTGHVDNNRGQLQKLATPGYEESAEYRRKLQIKVLGMIDSLVLHLKDSRDSLTKAEIKAGEDFAIFQTSMIRENAYLEAKIKELTAHLLDLQTQLGVSERQLVVREQLRLQAEEALATLRRIKKEKEEYNTKENARRIREMNDVNNAQAIFQNVLDKLSLRVKLRTQSNVDGKSYNAAQAASQSVVQAASSVETSVAKVQKERNAVAYY